MISNRGPKNSLTFYNLEGFEIEGLIFVAGDHILINLPKYPADHGCAFFIGEDVIEIRINGMQPVIRLLLNNATHAGNIKDPDISVAKIHGVLHKHPVPVMELRFHALPRNSDDLIGSGNYGTVKENDFFFFRMLRPVSTIACSGVTTPVFNTVHPIICSEKLSLRKFEDVEYVELLLNTVKNCIAIRPCSADCPNAIHWGRLREEKWIVSSVGSRGLSSTLFDMMNWEEEAKYRFKGQFISRGDDKLLSDRIVCPG